MHTRTALLRARSNKHMNLKSRAQQELDVKQTAKIVTCFDNYSIHNPL